MTFRPMALAVTLIVLALPASASAAGWAEVPLPPGTGDVNAVEYQGGDRFWLATGSGQILRKVGNTFQVEATDPTTVFKDIEFQSDGGQVGFAVGTNGAVYRSANGGDTWTEIELAGGRDTEVNGCDATIDDALGDAETVRFAGNSRAWILAGGTQIFRTINGATPADVGSSAGAWEYINDVGADDCKIERDMDDLFPIPNSNGVYFISKYFGEVWFTSNALDTTATRKPASAGNGFEQTRRVAGDPANPNRQWAVSPNGGGGSYVQRTTDGWSTALNLDKGGETVTDYNPLHDVDYAGGTILAAGNGGQIVNSNDGVTFFIGKASGALETHDWRSVSLASGTEAAIGGVGGKLLVSTNANVTPDVTPPTGTIGGPSTGRPNQPLTFTAQIADEGGGSGTNAAGSQWSTPSLTGQTGPSATFTFANPGTYPITLTFFDNAGNSATASKSVTISGKPFTGPTFTFPSANNPPVSGGGAKKKGKFVRVKVKGKVTPPSGFDTAAACTGTVRISVYRGKKLLKRATVSLSDKCRYKKTLKIKRKKVGKETRRLKLRIRFNGNSVISRSSATYTIPIK